MDQVASIPVYHSSGSMAYRTKYGNWGGSEAQYAGKNWTGIVNSQFPTTTSGVNDIWTLFNAHPQDFKKGGILRYGLMNDATVINPVMQYWYWDAIILDPVYDRLVHFDPISGNLVPDAATGWTIGTWDNGGTNATMITFRLCPSIKWHDDQPFNSTDVAFTMKYMYDASSPLFYSNVEVIDGIDTETPHIETPDQYTVVIYFTTESIWALQLAGLVPIIPKHVWESIPPDQCEALGEYVTTGNLTGTGPYVIASHTPNESWLLKANPEYHMRKTGDLASGVPPTFFKYDGKVDGKDLSLFLLCFKGLAPADAKWPCDLGGGVPPTFFKYDGKVDGKDLALFLQCFKGLGP
jgi:ABC-type transport system substrate-binding protein